MTTTAIDLATRKELQNRSDRALGRRRAGPDAADPPPSRASAGPSKASSPDAERERGSPPPPKRPAPLRPLEVVNPYAHRADLPRHPDRTRRDHEKYLTLIDTIALLHQHQREVKRPRRGQSRALRYVEVELADVEAANRLASRGPGHARSTSCRRRPAASLARSTGCVARRRANSSGSPPEDVRFTGAGRAQDAARWRRHAAQGPPGGAWSDLEYLSSSITARAGATPTSSLPGRGRGRRPLPPGLIDVATLRERLGYDGERSESGKGRSAPEAAAVGVRSAPGRPPVGGWSEGAGSGQGQEAQGLAGRRRRGGREVTDPGETTEPAGP